MKLIFALLCSMDATAALIEIVRSISSGLESSTVLPSSTRPMRFVTPALKRIASPSVVLPVDWCPTSAVFLMSSIPYFFNVTSRNSFSDASVARQAGRGRHMPPNADCAHSASTLTSQTMTTGRSAFARLVRKTSETPKANSM